MASKSVKIFLTLAFLLIGATAMAEVTAVIKTTKGDIELNLFPEEAPVTVANFVNLSSRGYYDGIVFHRVIPNFMIQGGDPTGTGMGGPGYEFEDEFSPKRKHSTAGVLSMANAGPGTNGSQFFITHLPTPHLDNKHSVFGQVTHGQDVVNKIIQGDKILDIEIKGDSKSVLEKEKVKVESWNQTLDKKFPKK
jgi:peptidyl-prolyl cis-trans isomerase B (cyclophilin B)